MPGYEYINYQEREMVDKVFSKSGGILYRYGFDKLRSRYFVKEFEQAFSEHFKVPYTLAVSSGSSALKVSLQALGVKRGDEVITQAHTFIATVEAIVEVGATPVIANVDKTLNMDPTDLESLITPKTKCIIPVHMGGVSCKMNEIQKIANEYPIPILEDNAQSPGGTYNGKFLGTIGTMGIFSFDGGKMLTTGEGGMITTHNEGFYKRARAFSDHGHADTPGKPRGEDDCVGLGFNHKMMELQGAVGLVQLSKIDTIIADHYRNKTKLQIQLQKSLGNKLEFREIPNPDGELGDSLTFFLPTATEAKRFVNQWKGRGFSTKNIPDALNWHFSENWTHIKMKHNDLTPSRELLSRAIALPITGKMTDDQISNISKNAKEIMEEL